MQAFQPGLVTLIVVGGIAGWLAGMLLKGRSLGTLGNVCAGIAGAFVGSRIAYMVGFTVTSVFGVLLGQFLGAVLVLVLIGAVKSLMGKGD